ncbi:MAG: hypothetical protein K6L74_15685 [Neptuniibacter sp.]
MTIPKNIDELELQLQKFSITHNHTFQQRYFITASQALEAVKKEPLNFYEFIELGEEIDFVDSVVDTHRGLLRYSSILIYYAEFEEAFRRVLKKLGSISGACVSLNDLRDSGVRGYKKFIYDVCQINKDNLFIDWVFIEDFTNIRHALIHANGNLARAKNRKKLEEIVRRYAPDISVRHNSKLTFSDSFIFQCSQKSLETCLAILELIEKKR